MHTLFDLRLTPLQSDPRVKMPKPAHQIQDVVQMNLPSMTAVAPKAAMTSGAEIQWRSLLARTSSAISNAVRFSHTRYLGSAMNVSPTAPSTEAKAGRHAGQVSVGTNENPSAGTMPIALRDFMSAALPS